MKRLVFIAIIAILWAVSCGDSPARMKYKAWLGEFKGVSARISELKKNLEKGNTNDMAEYTKLLEKITVLQEEAKIIQTNMTESEKQESYEEIVDVLSEYELY